MDNNVEIIKSINVIPSNAYGMMICLSEDFETQLEEYLHNSNAENKYDIGIQYGGVTKAFSFSEFLKLLGFERKNHA